MKRKFLVVILVCLAFFGGLVSNAAQNYTVAVQKKNVSIEKKAAEIKTIKKKPVKKVKVEVKKVEVKKVQTVKKKASNVPLSNNNYYTNSQGNKVHSPALAPSRPSGASARCRDGSYSFSQSRRGTCSHHGGVGEWY